MIPASAPPLRVLRGYRLFRCPSPLRGLPLPPAELLLRAQFLPAEDAALLTFYLERRASVRALARLTGRSAGSISRQCRRLVEVLAGPRFGPLIRLAAVLPRPYRHVFREYFLSGLHAPELARRHNLCVGALRRLLRDWAAQVARAARAPVEENRPCLSRPA